jgi:hypothetical protein
MDAAILNMPRRPGFIINPQQQDGKQIRLMKRILMGCLSHLVRVFNSQILAGYRRSGLFGFFWS